MKPKKKEEQELFKIRLEKLIDLNHPLVKLAGIIEWESLDKVFDKMYCQDNGRHGISNRLMIGLHYLKYANKLSDEEVVKK